MLAYPDIDPVALEIGPLRLHWYGIMYLAGFGAAWWLGRLRARNGWRGWSAADVDDVIFYSAVGVILGGRVGYVLFYDVGRFAAEPLAVFAVWQGGMSFHGGLIGVLVAMGIYARQRGRAFFEVADFVAPLVPPGLAAGRLGNFINGNLWGRESDLPWAMIFPDARSGGVPRHPSQLYEAALEGLALFVVLWVFSARPRPTMAVSGLFLLAYGVFRFAVEFVRVPDAHIGYLGLGWVTMGHVLTVPMIAGGLLFLVVASRGRQR